MVDVDNFKKFLTRVRKPNGEKLLDSTIKQYANHIGNYSESLNECGNDEQKILKFMNRELNFKRNRPMYSAFKLYLFFLGFTKRDDVIKDLQCPPRIASAITSERELQKKVMSRAEIKLLFENVDEESKFIYSMLYDTAIRRAELVNMRFGDIIFTKNPEEKGIYGEVKVIGKGNTKKIVFFGKTTYFLMKKLKPIETRKPEDKVFEFLKPDGTPIKDQTHHIYKKMIKHTKKILGKKFSPHAFRHSKLTHLADDGADLLGISRVAHHQSFSTTGIYVKSSSLPARLAVEKHSHDINEES